MSSEEFRALVEATGLKKSKIAEILGVSPLTIGNWVGGKRQPSKLAIAVLRDLAEKINQAGINQ